MRHTHTEERRKYASRQISLRPGRGNNDQEQDQVQVNDDDDDDYQKARSYLRLLPLFPSFTFSTDALLL